MPSPGLDLVARLADMPALPQADLGAPVENSVTVLLEPDDPALDEFVARCLAQLRQVMDELQ